MTKNLARESEPTLIKLANGQEYKFVPLTSNIMVEVEEKFEKPFTKLFEEGRMAPIRYLIYVILKETYPDMTEEKVGELLTPKVLAEINKAIVKQLGG